MPNLSISRVIGILKTLFVYKSGREDQRTADPEGRGHKADVVKVIVESQDEGGHKAEGSSHNAQQERPEQKAPLDDAFDIDVDELLEMLDVEGEYCGFTLWSILFWTNLMCLCMYYISCEKTGPWFSITTLF